MGASPVRPRVSLDLGRGRQWPGRLSTAAPWSAIVIPFSIGLNLRVPLGFLYAPLRVRHAVHSKGHDNEQEGFQVLQNVIVIGLLGDFEFRGTIGILRKPTESRS